MSSRTSVEPPPEFFVDRSLGKVTTENLRRELGWTVRRLADVFEHDAQDVDDPEWIRHGCDQGWVLLTKDKHIRFREHELSELAEGSFLFCLSRGNLTLDEQTAWFVAASASIERALLSGKPGFWTIYSGGRVERRWPTS